jgi:glucose/arabinose dehydrogenase
MAPLRITGRVHMTPTACTAAHLIVALQVRVATAHLAHIATAHLHHALQVLIATTLRPHALQVHVTATHLHHPLQVRVATRPLRLHITAAAVRALVIMAAIMATLRARAHSMAALMASTATLLGVAEHPVHFPQAICSFPFVCIKFRGNYFVHSLCA